MTELLSMSEKIARALIDEDPTISGYHQSHIKYMMPRVRAVLKVMLEPSDAMTAEGGDYLLGAKSGDHRLDAQEVFMAMIRVALDEPAPAFLSDADLIKAYQESGGEAGDPRAD